MATRESPEVHISGGDGLLSVNEFQVCAKAVCCIKIKHIDKPRRGTGFYSTVVINGKECHGIVTNNHVLSNEGEAQQAEAVFGYDNKNEGKRVSLRPDLIFRTNQKLDYSFIGVQKEDIQALQLGIFPIPLRQEPEISQTDQVLILQHPKGRPKEFSHDKIKDIKHPFIYYKADTERGSSGAPVFCKMNLVAVHQEGFEEREYNKGVLCSGILSDLDTGTPDSTNASTMNNEDNEVTDSPSPVAVNQAPAYARQERCPANSSEMVTGTAHHSAGPQPLPAEKKIKCILETTIGEAPHTDNLKRMLKVRLDPSRLLGGDIKSLASEFGYNGNEINYLTSKNYGSPTEELLNSEGHKTIEFLLEKLVAIDRDDAAGKVREYIRLQKCECEGCKTTLC